MPPSAKIEDALTLWMREQRRKERPVSRDSIVSTCMQLLPGFLDVKSAAARLAWCDKFMKRQGLSIRIISHSGSKNKQHLTQLKEAFALEVSTLLIDHFISSSLALPPPYCLYNMDQISVFCDLGARTTVDFVGATRVPCTVAGKGSYCCTVALTVCADGRMLQPHIVFKGELHHGVHEQVLDLCDSSGASVSVQTSAWFCERVMLEWVHDVWRHDVTGPYVLILDPLRIHKAQNVQNALANLGTVAVYVPGGCACVAQPLNVGVMGPFKQKLRELYVARCAALTPP